METFTVLPDKPIAGRGKIAALFSNREIHTFREACRFVHELPYGYNSDRDDLTIIFGDKMGTCTTKHAIIATLAAELGLPVVKHIGIYAMTESIVTGTGRILNRFGLPHLPMVHCFLFNDGHRVDLTEGNNNGKNRSIDDFLYTETVAANVSSKEEYLLYRKALRDRILKRPELEGVELKTILQARELGLGLLKANVHS
ncbi:MAG: hypothetical protein HKM93_23595 [Desulfobacteraceae bacterium]|nr:hypothetical protein [Desulfobacteraceae bacterium]